MVFFILNISYWANYICKKCTLGIDVVPLFEIDWQATIQLQLDTGVRLFKLAFWKIDVLDQIPLAPGDLCLWV